MILLCGIPTESPLALVRDRLDEIGADYLVLSQRRFAGLPFRFRISAGCIEGEVTVDGRSHRLEDVVGVYARLMDYRRLPEVTADGAGPGVATAAAAWSEAVSRWCEITPARVVNRMAAMGSNTSKPYQAQMITRRGFLTPATLITTDPERARDFVEAHGRVIYKSISGVRSIVREVGPDDLSRLNQIRHCPVQFQGFVEGRNVRVHTIGGDVFATGIQTDVTDYRYAQRQGGETALDAVELSDDVAAQCLALAQDLGLPLAGIDLKVTDSGGVYCFEVNPSPAFSYYESQTGQPISASIARYLSGGPGA